MQTNLVVLSLLSKFVAKEEMLQNIVSTYISDLEDLSLHYFPLYDDNEIYERSEENNAYKKDFVVQGNLHKDFVQEWIESEHIFKFTTISEPVYDLYENSYN